MKDLLKKLTDTFSPSGHENAIREVIRKEVRDYADEVRVDALGNLIVRRTAAKVAARRNPGKRVMIAAHMDEIGLMATHIDSRGFVRFTGVGGVFARNLPGARVRFAGGAAGVIGLEPLEGGTSQPTIDKMFIDVGASNSRNCPVKIGDVAAFERPFLDLGERVVAKAMDNRAGCAAAIEILRQLRSPLHEVYFVFTTQEELNSQGAETSAYGIDPDLGFSLDVTTWGDTPGQQHVDMILGKGPAIKIRDTGMLADPRIVRWMMSAAEKNKIPYQREVLLGGTTDASVMQIVRAGVPVGSVSIPCRYVHSASEMVDVNDLQNSVKLVLAMLRLPVKLD